MVNWNLRITEQDNEDKKSLEKDEKECSPQKKQKKSAQADKKVKQDTKKKDEQGGEHVSNKQESSDSDVDSSD